MVKGTLIKRGLIWYAVWRHAGRQHWKSTGEKNKSAARDILATTIAPLNSGDIARSLRAAASAAENEVRHDRAAALRLTDIWEEFSTSASRTDTAPSTLYKYKIIITRMADWFAGHLPNIRSAADVSPVEAGEFARWLLDQIGQSTFNINIIVLRSTWKTLTRNHGFVENPWNSISLRRSQPVCRREFTVDELGRILAAATGEIRTLIAMGLYTGMRLGDCATLQWSECDLAAGMIRRRPQKTRRRTNKVLQIPIHSGLMDILKAQIGLDTRYVLPSIQKAYPNNLNYHLRRVLDRAGIQRITKKCEPGRVRHSSIASFHSLRHTFVSLCASNPAIQASWVQTIVGHSNPAMTAHYTHIGAESARRAIDSLPTIGDPIVIRDAPIPTWAARHLAAMTDANWREIREALLNAEEAAPHTPRALLPPSTAETPTS